jgi:hypothetical protein
MRPNKIGPITLPSGLLVFMAPTTPPLCFAGIEDATDSFNIGMKRESPIPNIPIKKKIGRMDVENGINATEMADSIRVSLTAIGLET